MKKTPKYLAIVAMLIFVFGSFSVSWLSPVLSSIFLILVAIFLVLFTAEHDGRR